MNLAFTSFTGIVAPLDVANVDTDAILPKQFLKRIERTGFGQFLFNDWRYENGVENEKFVLNQIEYKSAPILLTRRNFGCGSSREHAPWALSDFGIRVIIAPSFADIFYNNAFKNNILLITLDELIIDQLFKKVNSDKGYKLMVDLQNERLSDSNGFNAIFSIDSYQKNLLLRGLDEIDSTLQHDKKINSFEKQHNISFQLDSLFN